MEPRDQFAIADLILEDDLPAIEAKLREMPELLHTRSFDMGYTWLHYAASEGNMRLVEYFFDRGIPLNTTNQADECPLSSIIDRRNLEWIQWMLDRGADPKLCHAPMISAVSYNVLEAVKQFVERGADINFTFGRPLRTPLSQAIDRGFTEVADYLRSLNAALPPGYSHPSLTRQAVDLGDFVLDDPDTGPPVLDLTEEVKDYFTYHLERPPDTEALQELIPGKVGVAVWTINPRQDDLPKVIFTTGMSHSPLNVPPGAEQHARCELVMYLDGSWPAPPDLKDEARSWPWLWLRRLAHYPHENDSWYGEWATTFSNGEPPQPLGPGTEFTAFLLATNLGALRGFPSDDGPYVNIINVIPLYTEELVLAQGDDGTRELLRRFQANDIGAILRPGRPNVVRT